MARFDFYTRPHKMLRGLLFEATLLAGSSDDCDAVAQVVDTMLRAFERHAEHEDTFVRPMLAEHLPECLSENDADHGALHAEVERLRGILDAPELYRELCAFAAAQLAHMDHEERVLLPRIHATCPEEACDAVMAAFLRSRTPAEVRSDLLSMYPRLSPAERAETARVLRSRLDARAFAALFRELEATRT